MNVSKNTQEALMEFIKQCFVENRKLDRLVSVLGVKFVCNNMAKLIHLHISHYFPGLSDKVGELCLERYNIPVEYGETPSGYEDYTTVTEIIQVLQDRTIEFQNMFIGLCKVAFENNDLHVFANLQSLLKGYNYIVEQAILLNDKIHGYGESNAISMDAHVTDWFWVIPEDILNGKTMDEDD